MTAEIRDAADLVERLRAADRDSEQRILGSRIFAEAADMIERQDALLRDFCACFGSFDRPLGRSLQGWDNPRLHRIRDKIIGGHQPIDDGPPGEPPNEGTSGRKGK